MVAAPNPDAHEIAGKSIFGVYYMDPDYDPEGELYSKFIKLYRNEYNSEPAVPFHVASVIDSIELLQRYLDHNSFTKEGFQNFLDHELGEVCGYMGCYRLDSEGNSNLGFHSNQIVEKK